MNIKNIYGFVFLCLCGCGLSPKKGDLPIITDFPNVNKMSTITYRVYSRSEAAEDKIILRNDQFFEKSVEKSLIESAFFVEVSRDRLFNETDEYFSIEIPKDKELEKVSINQVAFKTDYYLDITSRPRFTCGTGYVGWAVIHWISLGLIPMVFDNQIDVIIKLYDKDKKLIDQRELKDENSLVAWSPNIFIENARIMPNFTEVQAPLELNLMNNYLNIIRSEIQSP